MKIALCGSAPSSMMKAPFGDSSWQIWGCSPALYPFAPRIDAWFEMHRWEPPVIGKPDQQVPWFSPEYCLWMAQRPCPVWMLEAVPNIPKSQRIPWEALVKKYGHFFFNSSLSWMAAMAIEAILLNRELQAEGDDRAFPTDPVAGDCIGFWGVDMAADEEQYTGQKQGCQFFAVLGASMNIHIHTPPESDLMIPRALYGVSENTHRHIKLLTRHKHLLAQKAQAEQQIASATANLHYCNGALEDMKYHLNTWVHEGAIDGPKFEDMTFAKPVLSAPPQPRTPVTAAGLEGASTSSS